VREWVIDKAKRKGLEVIEDKAGNVVVRKPAYKGREGAHHWSRCKAILIGLREDENIAHDFENDPICVVRKRRLALCRRDNAWSGQRSWSCRSTCSDGMRRHRARAAGVRLHRRRRAWFNWASEFPAES